MPGPPKARPAPPDHTVVVARHCGGIGGSLASAEPESYRRLGARSATRAVFAGGSAPSDPALRSCWDEPPPPEGP
ncbi:hypothetical protein V7793_37585, partial [Streptomyces sp. KLMMK]|uniref:hypothetical protein n=1 Tax=Streptomyces sp. KLMMK TaxID=3109353 RepID=UPI00300A4AE5